MPPKLEIMILTKPERHEFLEQLVLDRDTASRLGLTTSTIDNTLYDSFGQRQISTMFTEVNQYHVILEVDPRFQQDPSNLNDVYITPST